MEPLVFVPRFEFQVDFFFKALRRELASSTLQRQQCFYLTESFVIMKILTNASGKTSES